MQKLLAALIVGHGDTRWNQRQEPTARGEAFLVELYELRASVDCGGPCCSSMSSSSPHAPARRGPGGPITLSWLMSTYS